MYCCDQSHCPKREESQDAQKEYCCVVPHGLCCPDYSDSYCETYTNNPMGKRPLNRADTMRTSCCSSNMTGNNNNNYNNNNNGNLNSGMNMCAGRIPPSKPHYKLNCPCRCNPEDDSNNVGSGRNRVGHNGGGCSEGCSGAFNPNEIYVGFNENLYGGR